MELVAKKTERISLYAMQENVVLNCEEWMSNPITSNRKRLTSSLKVIPCCLFLQVRTIYKISGSEIELSVFLVRAIEDYLIYGRADDVYRIPWRWINGASYIVLCATDKSSCNIKWVLICPCFVCIQYSFFFFSTILKTVDRRHTHPRSRLFNRWWVLLNLIPLDMHLVPGIFFWDTLDSCSSSGQVWLWQKNKWRVDVVSHCS